VPRRKQEKVETQRKRLRLYEHQRLDSDAYTLHHIIRSFLAWHRRAGKDVYALDFAHDRAMERVGQYWHMFPFHVQARRAIWKGIDARTGERFIDRAFPDRIDENDTEMSIVLPNKSTWQMLGSDYYDRMVGSNPAGVIMSEHALGDPAALEYIRPILLENKGWLKIITTFRGRNHAYRLFEAIRHNPEWYADLRTIEDTCRHDGTPIVSAADVEKEIEQGMSRSLARQEFYLDVDAANTGAIFALQHAKILNKPVWTPEANNKRVTVSWGMKDSGIAAVVHQGKCIIAVHIFVERNIVDAVQSVARRHHFNHVVHAGVRIDRSLFNELDGNGCIDIKPPTIEMQDGRTAALLNVCEVSRGAKEILADFAMSYAPHRDNNDDENEQQKAYAAIAQALMVMHHVPKSNNWGSRPDRSQYDRGVI
jgi:hypothetical protein